VTPVTKPWFLGTQGNDEPSPTSRGFLGIELDRERNAANANVISVDSGRVAVRVMRRDEEWMIAKTVCRVLGLSTELGEST